MPPKFASLKPRTVIRALQKGGFVIHEQTGSHVQLKHPHKTGRVTVPNHERFDLPKHIVKSIVRQAELTNAEFLSCLIDSRTLLLAKAGYLCT
jgi:predicted RNA binding protein YcfA (HicA-like mRNA interferase family)